MRTGRRTIVFILIAAALLMISIPVLGNDSAVFLKWYACVLLFGLGYYPLAARLFSTFADKGFAFSKVLGIFFGGFLMWYLGACGLSPFNMPVSIFCAALPAATCWILYARNRKKEMTGGAALSGRERIVSFNPDLVLLEEIIFIAVFLLWTYIVAFKPEARGTEKYMDYGFLTSFMRTETIPAKDMWFSFYDLNYYYGGQYFAAYLAKVTGTSAAYAYNLMRTLIAGFACVLPFSITAHLISGKKGGKHRDIFSIFPLVGGTLSGLAVCFAGNMHYVLYKLFGELLKLPGYEDYFFPSPTRFIGHNPLIADDQCIHEFPSYSFLLGDLHAHMVNIIFVLLLLGIFVSWFRKREAIKERELLLFEKKGMKYALLSVLIDPAVWMFGLLTGIYKLNNYWDFAIYLTVLAIGTFAAFLRFSKKGVRFLYFVRWIAQMALIILLGLLTALPFTLTFRTMESGVGISSHHTALYQLAVLWGLPAVCVIALFIFVLARYRLGFFRKMQISDMIALIFGICAIGLVLVPELVYVRDIYEENYARSNTMFKMTYQAFILFGMTMPYTIVRLFISVKKRIVRGIVRAAALVLLGLFILTCGYFPDSVGLWFGDVTDRSRFRGLNAENFIYEIYPHDACAIKWLENNVEGTVPIIEANGNSYSDNAVVSAMTGLPTVLGWYVHEWLWRSDKDAVQARAADVSAFYNASDPETLDILIEKYGIKYIFIGSNERSAFPEMNELLLQKAGHIVCDNINDPESAYIIEVD